MRQVYPRWEERWRARRSSERLHVLTSERRERGRTCRVASDEKTKSGSLTAVRANSLQPAYRVPVRDRVRDDKLKKWAERARRRRVDDHSPFRATCSYVFRVSIERRSLKEEKNVPRPSGRVAVCGELTRICRGRAGGRGRLRVFVQRAAGQGSGAASASLR